MFGLATALFCIFIAFLLTLNINRKTPKGERVGTWFRAWWLGMKIAIKISLCCILILIPMMLKWSTDVSPSDLSVSDHWYDHRKKVRDDAGNEYEVGTSGDYIRNSNGGDWIRVNKDSDGDPYIGSNSDRTYLK